MTLSDDNQPPKGRNAGAVPVWGPAQAAPATSLTVGAVGFGPAWSVEDSMAASIVRLQCEVEEREARIAVLEEQARILVAERDQARAQYQTTHLLAEALAKTQVELKAERDNYASHLNQVCDELGMGDGYIAVDAAIMAAAEIKRLKESVESLRDERCADKCRDKAAADGGWANI